MGKIYQIWVSIICVLGLTLMGACQKEELLVNENNVSYVQFTKDITKDSTIVCFQLYPEQPGDAEKLAQVSLEVFVTGKIQDKDLNFTVSVDESLSTYPASKCILPETCVIKKGELKGWITLNIKNSPELREATKRLILKINEAGEVREGIFYNARAILSLTDKLAKPEWWELKDQPGSQSSVDLYYLGDYSETKYKWFIEILRENDDLQFDGKDKNKLRKYSLQLKYKIEEYNEAHPEAPLSDEYGKIEIPVVG